MFENYSDLVSIEELCEMLFIGKNVAYELLQRKKIKAFRIGRLWKIPKRSVEEYILSESKIDRKYLKSFHDFCKSHSLLRVMPI